MKIEQTKAAKRARLIKSRDVEELWAESCYKDVIDNILEKHDLKLIGHLVFALLRIKEDILWELVKRDGRATDEDIRDCVSDHLLQW